jgi:hypothetical protein
MRECSQPAYAPLSIDLRDPRVRDSGGWRLPNPYRALTCPFGGPRRLLHGPVHWVQAPNANRVAENRSPEILFRPDGPFA